MHDHNRVNYNKEYSFSNIECNAHLLRDLQKVTDYRKHKWSLKFKELLGKTNTERNEALERGEDAFSDEYEKDFYSQFDLIILHVFVEITNDCIYTFLVD